MSEEGKTSNNMKTISEDRLRAFTVQLFVSYGLSPENAEIVADNLVEADLRGVSSHGVLRCKLYCTRLCTGQIVSSDYTEIVRDEGAVALINGNNFFGAVVGTRAMRLAMEKAKKYGIGMVCAQHSTHFGTCAYFAEIATREDFICMVGTNTIPLLPPMGGLERKVGNNPIAFGVPSSKYYPVILDIATSQAAMGKIILAATEGRPIPNGWATDKEGNPTTDANEAIKGFLLPAAGPKGFGLAIIIDLLSGVLSGADYGGKVNNLNLRTDVFSNIGHFFIAIDPDYFLGKEDLKAKVDWYIEYVKDCQLNSTVKEVFLPGELECRKRDERRATGIPISEALLSELRTLATDVGLAWEEYLG